MLNAWVVIAKNKEYDQHRSKTDGDRKAGSEQDAGDHC